MSAAIAAFAAALLVGLTATPAVRRVALAANFVDRPGMHKSHARPVAYLGGVAIVVATLLGATAGELPTRNLALAIALAAGLSIIGLLDDDRLVKPALRLGAQLAAATAVTASGIRIEGSGIRAMDFILTVVWIVAITNAVNFLDNMDGLSSGICGVTAMAAAVLGVGSGQFALATLAAAIGGACLSFIAFNAKPATIFMGDAGSLFLGFLMAVIVVEVAPASRPPDSFAIPALLLALPCLDIGTVVIGRLRRRMPVTVGGRNHLSHRLVRRGLSRGWAVAVLVGVQTFSAALAVGAARRLVDTYTAVLLVSVVLAALAAVTIRADVWAQPVLGFEPRIRKAALACLGIGFVLSAPAIVLLASARGDMARGARAAELAIQAVQAGDLATATAQFEIADRELSRAADRANSPVVSLGLTVPILNSNITGTRELLETARDLSRAARQLTPRYSARPITIRDGRFDLAAAAAHEPTIRQARAALDQAERRLSTIEEPFLISAVADRVHRLQAAVAGAHHLAERAELLRDRSSALLGSETPRTYALLLLDAGDPTPIGGMPVAWAPLGIDKGTMSLGAFTELSRSSIDAITFDEAAGEVLGRVDGTQSLAGVVALTGSGLERLSSGLGGAATPAGTTTAELASSAKAVFASLATSTHSMHSLRNAIAPAVASRHLQIHLLDATEAEILAFAGMPDSLPAIPADAVLVTTQSKVRPSRLVIDDASYAVRLEPSGDRVLVNAFFNATLTGANATQVAVHTPLGAASAQINGKPTAVTTTPGAVLAQHSMNVDANQAELGVRLAGTVTSSDGWYRLQILQPAGDMSPIEVRLTVADGWRIAEARGLTEHDGAAVGQVDGGTVVDVRLVPTGARGWLWQLRHGGSQ